MRRTFFAVAAVVGAGLVAAAGMTLADEVKTPSNVLVKNAVVPAHRANETAEKNSVRVRDVLLVVNKDGSAAIGAYLESVKDFEVSLMGVVVSVEGRHLPVNSTEMWLPVPSGERVQVGAASDAGGFVVPDGVGDATRAEVEFHLDDGPCVLTEARVVARTGAHRWVYPRSGKPIGPGISDRVPAAATSCVQPAVSQS